ncbi:hypothetical protein B1218_36555, partial [Pseudomonas ogarae]
MPKSSVADVQLGSLPGGGGETLEQILSYPALGAKTYRTRTASAAAQGAVAGQGRGGAVGDGRLRLT